MKVLLLSDANSIHTKRWVSGLNDLKVKIALWSISGPKTDFYDQIQGVEVFSAGLEQNRFSMWQKLKYLTLLRSVKAAIQKFQPDILHAHYASSFGLLGALTQFHPFILSVWGSDVYEFPNQNVFFKKILTYNFSKADVLLSTSHSMAKEAAKFTSKPFLITPFGIDLQLFSPNNMTKNKIFTIGTIKTLEKKYGIDLLIQAFCSLKKMLPTINLKLRIVGEGSLKEDLIQQADQLGLGKDCEFVGAVPYEQVPHELEKLDVCLCLSRSESFGVAAIEASAMELPVIVSDAGGLPEVIDHENTGFVIANGNPDLAAEAILKLYKDEELRRKMGKAGRIKVQEEFDWKENLQMMKLIYKDSFKTF